MSAHILTVDDDKEVREAVERYLSKQGYRVTCASDGNSAAELLAGQSFDLVLLDLILPDEDGLDIARQIRGHSAVPIIMLTGRADEVDRIIGLEMGADDYIVKPFSLRELGARIKSVLRRAAPTQTSAQPDSGEVAEFSGWRLDIANRQLYDPDDQPIDVTSGEFDLPLTLVQHPQRTLDRDQLITALTHADEEPDKAMSRRSVDVQVLRLRRKLEADTRRPVLIKTVRGAGYFFAAKVDWRGTAGGST
ncbi:MAG: response regulator transcription factor [Candidatus Latescibacteria bacterium]|nr:response regulator transcription factor [Candidatus Latescibacterota bacterium]